MVKSKIKLDKKLLQTGHSSILGCWDKSLPGTQLGTLLIFLAECQLVASTSKANNIDIALDASSHKIKNISEGQFRLLNNNDEIDAALTVFNGMDTIKKIYICGGRSGIQALSLSLKDTHLIWGLNKQTYDSTVYIQELYKLTGKLQPLKFKPELQVWAYKAIQEKHEKFPVVALHLKQLMDWKGTNPISLANNSAWYKFLSIAASRYNIKFIVLGDDPLDINIKNLPNVILANEMGAKTFVQHFALLSECVGFMGMMSSISNLALFSNMPYVVFKNPEHHKNEMDEEIGLKNYYTFATKFQKVLRVHETVDLLLSEFSAMPFIKTRS